MRPGGRRPVPGAPITRNQVSAGGVVYRQRDRVTEVALISVGERRRWQLPKGTVDPGETPEKTALREVREEAGVEAELLDPLDRVEYWYYANEAEGRVRFHKLVHFYLMAYRAGDVRDHDHEVQEARWVPIEEAITLLAFENERKVVERALAKISARQ